MEINETQTSDLIAGHLGETLTQMFGQQVITLQIQLEYSNDILPRYSVSASVLDRREQDEEYNPQVVVELDRKPDEEVIDAHQESYRTIFYPDFRIAIDDLAHHFGINPQFTDSNNEVKITALSVDETEKMEERQEIKTEGVVEFDPKVYKIRASLVSLNQGLGVFIDFVDIRIGTIFLGDLNTIDILPEDQLVNIIEVIARRLNRIRQKAQENYNDKNARGMYTREDI